MADLLTIPKPDAAIGSSDAGPVIIDPVWYQKFTAWLLKTNNDTLSTNGKLTVVATSNTNLRFSLVGTDGVTRTANLTLV